MAVGLPVVSSDLSGIPELVLQNETGFLVEPGDSRQLADAIARLAADPELRRQMGEVGRARVLDQFDARRNVTELYRLLGQVGGLADQNQQESRK